MDVLIHVLRTALAREDAGRDEAGRAGKQFRDVGCYIFQSSSVVSDLAPIFARRTLMCRYACNRAALILACRRLSKSGKRGHAEQSQRELLKRNYLALRHKIGSMTHETWPSRGYRLEGSFAPLANA